MVQHSSIELMLGQIYNLSLTILTKYELVTHGIFFQTKMSSSVVLSMTDIDTLNKQITNLMDAKPLPEIEIKMLCEKAKEILSDESNV